MYVSQQHVEAVLTHQPPPQPPPSQPQLASRGIPPPPQPQQIQNYQTQNSNSQNQSAPQQQQQQQTPNPVYIQQQEFNPKLYQNLYQARTVLPGHNMPHFTPVNPPIIPAVPVPPQVPYAPYPTYNQLPPQQPQPYQKKEKKLLFIVDPNTKQLLYRSIDSSKTNQQQTNSSVSKTEASPSQEPEKKEEKQPEEPKKNTSAGLRNIREQQQNKVSPRSADKQTIQHMEAKSFLKLDKIVQQELEKVSHYERSLQEQERRLANQIQCLREELVKRDQRYAMLETQLNESQQLVQELLDLQLSLIQEPPTSLSYRVGLQLFDYISMRNHAQVTPQPGHISIRDLPHPPAQKSHNFDRGRCPICFEAFTEVTSIVATQCGHLFCEACMYRAVQSEFKQCPECRAKLGYNYYTRLHSRD